MTGMNYNDSNNNNNNNNKQFLFYQLKWIGIYIVTGLVISFILPFPISLVVALAAFFLLNFIRNMITLKKAGIDVKQLFRSISSSSPYSSPSADSAPSMMYWRGYTPIRYYCISCGKEHKEIACPKCGSKVKRVGF
jgi:hypothetical protein